MHEMSLVAALLEAVQQETAAYPGAQVRTVRLRVGALRQVVPATMSFCFAAATRDTPLAGATLEVESIPARARCRQCQAEFAVAEQWFECPTCHDASGDLIAGRELELTGIELEVAAPKPATLAPGSARVSRPRRKTDRRSPGPVATGDPRPTLCR